MGELKQGPIPTLGQLSESEGKHLRLRVKQLIGGSLNGKRIRESLLQPYIPQECIHTRQECWSPRMCSSWELEFRDCGAIPGQGLLSTEKDRVRGGEVGDNGGKCQ